MVAQERGVIFFRDEGQLLNASDESEAYDALSDVVEWLGFDLTDDYFAALENEEGAIFERVWRSV